MINFLGKLKKKQTITNEGELKCPCGEIAIPVPNEGTKIYLCKKCNKLLYHVERSPGNVRPLSLAWLKRKK